MEGGNGATNGSGITQFAEGKPQKLNQSSGSPNGECVIPFANAHFITAFQFFIYLRLRIRNKPIAPRISSAQVDGSGTALGSTRPEMSSVVGSVSETLKSVK